MITTSRRSETIRYQIKPQVLHNIMQKKKKKADLYDLIFKMLFTIKVVHLKRITLYYVINISHLLIIYFRNIVCYTGYCNLLLTFNFKAGNYRWTTLKCQYYQKYSKFIQTETRN